MNHATSDYFYYDSADGVRLYCRIYRRAATRRVPVLCLPGLTRNSRDFAALAAHLSARHEVLTADLRGRGRSAWDPDAVALSTADLRPGRLVAARCRVACAASWWWARRSAR